MLFIIYIIITHWSLVVESSHFYGGTVTWKPMNNTASGSTIPIMFTQSYQWRLSFAGAGCNQSTILNQSPMIPATSDKLTCTTTGSSCGGYTAISINEYCTDFSVLVDSSSGQISTVENIAVGSSFCVAYQGSAWVELYTTNCGGNGRKKRGSHSGGATTTAASGCYSSSAGWSIGTCINLTVRSDGFINTPPVATVISPIKVPVNSLTNIVIPVIDADNDYLRCRWAENTANLDECGDVCQAAPGSTLDEDNCTLTFNSTGKNVGDYFAVTLMVEDFDNSTSDTALSRVPIQFLIYIVNQTNCTSKPTISSTLPACSPIEVGTTFNFSLTIDQGCPGTTVTDVYTMPPQNVYKVSFAQNGTDNVWILAETWTPTSLQLGSQVYCAVATDSSNVQSDQYCTTFTVVPAGSSSLCPGETSTTSTTTITTTVTTTSSSSSTSSTVTTSSTTVSTSTSSSSSTSTSSTTKTTTTTTSTVSSTSTTTTATTTTTSTSTSTRTTSSTTTTTSSSTSTSSTSSTTTTTSSSTSTSSTSSTTSTTTTTATSSSTSTSSTSSTTSTTSTSTTASTTSSATTSTSTTSTATTVTTTSVTVPDKIDSITVKTTNQINLPLIIGLSLLGLLALLALCCCCCWRLFYTTFKRHRRKENEEKVTSKYTAFDDSLSHNQNRSSSKHFKSNKVNKISVFNPDDRLSQRSRIMATNSFEYRTDQNLHLSTTINEIKSQRVKINNVHVTRTNRLNKSFSPEENTSTCIPIDEIDDVSNVNLSKVTEAKLRDDTMASASSIPSVRVIKILKGHSSSKQNRNESLSSSSKSTTTTNIHNQSNELKSNHSTRIAVTKIKRLDHSSGINHNLNVIPNQSSVSITTPKNTLAKFQRNRPHTNAIGQNVTVTKVVRRKALT